MSAASLETLLHLTAAGYGVTLAPRLAVENRSAGGGALAAVPLRGEGMTRRVDLVFRRDTARRPALDTARRVRSRRGAGLSAKARRRKPPG